jgi:hypothetical protein
MRPSFRTHSFAQGEEAMSSNLGSIEYALIVEQRYAWGLAQGMKDEGLVLA